MNLLFPLEEPEAKMPSSHLLFFSLPEFLIITSIFTIATLSSHCLFTSASTSWWDVRSASSPFQSKSTNSVVSGKIVPLSFDKFSWAAFNVTTNSLIVSCCFRGTATTMTTSSSFITNSCCFIHPCTSNTSSWWIYHPWSWLSSAPKNIEKISTRKETHRFLRDWKVKMKFHFMPSATLYVEIQRANFTEIQKEFWESV